MLRQLLHPELVAGLTSRPSFDADRVHEGIGGFAGRGPFAATPGSHVWQRSSGCPPYAGGPSSWRGWTCTRHARIRPASRCDDSPVDAQRNLQGRTARIGRGSPAGVHRARRGRRPPAKVTGGRTTPGQVPTVYVPHASHLALPAAAHAAIAGERLASWRGRARWTVRPRGPPSIHRRSHRVIRNPVPPAVLGTAADRSRAR
jgi:hypothetical protein